MAIDWAKADGQEDSAKVQKHVLRSDDLYDSRVSERHSPSLFLTVMQMFCLLPNTVLLTNSGYGYKLWDLGSLRPVFRFGGSGEARPILRGGTPLEGHKGGTLHVISSDGNIKAAYTRTQSVEGVTLSTTAIENAPSALIRFNKREDVSGLVRIRLHSIDKFLELRDPEVYRENLITFKSAWFGSTYPCPTTSFRLEPRQFGNFYIDPYSGLIAMSDRIIHDQTLVDFPFMNS